MALSGLAIYKLLPQTNCKECGFPTCLAFAMKLAQKGTELSKCPYVTDETRASLDAAAAPPIRLVGVGTGERAFEIGNEVVLFRHEKTFYHQPGLMVRLRSDDPTWRTRPRLRRSTPSSASASCSASTASPSSRPAATRPRSPRRRSRGRAGDAPLALLADDPAALTAATAAMAARKPLLGAPPRRTWPRWRPWPRSTAAPWSCAATATSTRSPR